ncbi:CYFA0S19e02190g1_1 [Cyberlindnera fabianii]|uniref:CYFA0S19e02190g1_1 n=1 Tax=Cyberlindnera fabianii TaxID=36022 RepID=A0A061B726_CYBFA|nr:CYFA0S19e02190g1_1 [Cyberlindnera fabianii]
MRLSISLLHSIAAITTIAKLVLADGGFNVLTFNVAGLPEILQNNDEPLDKTTATTNIGKIFSELKDDLDIIHVQEDFNYHATLYKYDNHPYRTATSGGVPFGSGLNTLSNYDWINFERVKWSTCSDASEFDCLTPKGFTHMKIKLETGVYINFINLHADAGTEPGDESARNSNLQQIADWIDSSAYGEAVIIFGDTNCRYTRTDDNIAVFTTQNSMKDAWVELEMGGVAPSKGDDALLCGLPSTSLKCEIVDKVFYRSSKAIELIATQFDYVGDLFTYEGNQLSDHNPILVNFTYTLSDDYKTSDIVGSNNGVYFNDITSITTGTKTSKITLRGDRRVDNVGLTLDDGTVFAHGGDGGDEYSLALADDEYWTYAKVCTGTKRTLRIFYLEVQTSTGNTLSTGTETDTCYEYKAEPGYQIAGFYGQSADEVDQLGFIYIKQ